MGPFEKITFFPPDPLSCSNAAFSGIDGEDGQLVELDAVQEGGPGTNSNSLVRDTVHTNPGIFGVHFLHNLVPSGLLVQWIIFLDDPT